MSFKNQSVFSSTYTNTTFTVTEGMGISSITINLVSGSATLLGGLGIPGLTNSSVALTAGQPVVLNVNSGYTLEGVTVDSTAGGVFQVFTIYNYIDELDPSAAAYLAATGITGAVQSAAIDTLVRGLKADGLWSKMKAVYPFVTDNKNLASYTNTLTQASYWDKVGITLTSGQTDPTGGTNATRIVGTGAASIYALISLTTGATYTLSCYVKSTSGSNQTFRIYANGGLPFSPNLTATSTWQQVTLTFTAIAGTNSFGITRDSSTNNFDILAYGIQMEAGSTATAYQPIATTQQAFISSQFKYNLVNPVDSDAAFRLVFNGGWTHSSTGATPNGTNGYADTKLSPLSVLQLNDTSYSVYTNQNSTGYKMGIDDFGSSSWIRGVNSNNTQTTDHSNNSAFVPLIFVEDKGFVLANRISATTDSVFNNNVKYSRLNNSSGRSSRSYFIGAYSAASAASGYTSAQFRFCHMAGGLTDTEAANLYTRVQAFQNSLNRAVI